MGIRFSILSGVTDLISMFEPLFPQLAAQYLNSKLREYRKRRVLSDYEVKAGRKGRYHYVFEVDLFFKNDGGEAHE